MTNAAIQTNATAAPRAVTLPCARKWPAGLDGHTPRPLRGTWHPWQVRKTEDSAPYLVPLLSCPRCARPMTLVIDPDAARVLQGRARPGTKVAITHSISTAGEVTPEPKCACGWFGPVTLAEWNQWQTLYCAEVLEDGNPVMRSLYVHAVDARQASEFVARAGRRIVALAIVVRNDPERMVLL